MAKSAADQLLEPLLGGNTDEEDKRAKEAVDRMRGVWDHLTPADLQDINFETYNWNGDYTPGAQVHAPTVAAPKDISWDDADTQFADLALAPESAMNDVSTDPRLRDEQTAALDALSEIANGGGRTLADDANLNRIQNDVAASDRGRRDAIKQNMAARGMGGSGMDLLAQLQSSQAATDRASQGGLDIAADAEQRALDAIMQGGNMAGNLRGQDFDEQARIAAANDAISQFNAANTNGMNQWNTGAANDMNRFNTTGAQGTKEFNANSTRDNDQFNAGMTFDANKTNANYTNAAGMYNHEGRQGVSNAGVDKRNDMRMFNNYTKKNTNFDQRATQANGQSGAAQAEAGFYTGLGDREARKQSERVGAIGKMAGGGTQMVSDKRAKKDIEPLSDADITEFLQAVQPKKYRYKNPGTSDQPNGDRVGFLLQDVEGTKAGDALIEKDSDGRMSFDRDNLDGLILAALSKMAKKGNAA